MNPEDDSLYADMRAAIRADRERAQRRAEQKASNPVSTSPASPPPASRSPAAPPKPRLFESVRRLFGDRRDPT
jgi:hypothetical protein